MAASPTSQKSFLMYNDVIDTAEALSDDVAGKLFKHVLRYANGLDPIPDNEVVRIAFVNIKRNMDQNKEKWEKRSQVNKENGQKGGRPSNDGDLRDIPSQQEKPIETQNNPVGLVETQNNPQKPVTVNDTVSVPVNDNDKKNELLPTGNAPLVFAEKLNKAMNSIIPYLNEKAGTSFKANNKATVRLISARLKEGYGWHDFKAVIDGKTTEWIGNKEMKQYLRPSTLFGTKFESYVQAAKPPIINPEKPAQEDRNNQRGNIRFASPIL